MNWNNTLSFGLGRIVALLVLIACFVIWLADATLDRDRVLILIGALALARLVP